jgi:hypothetical protein
MKKFFEFVFVFFVGITIVFGQNQDTIDNDKSTLKKEQCSFLGLEQGWIQ